jgi:hypothetical protein
MRTSLDAVNTRLGAIEKRIREIEYGMFDVQCRAYAGATVGAASLASLERLAGPLGREEAVSELKKEAEDFVAGAVGKREAAWAGLDAAGVAGGSRGRVG